MQHEKTLVTGGSRTIARRFRRIVDIYEWQVRRHRWQHGGGSSWEATEKKELVGIYRNVRNIASPLLGSRHCLAKQRETNE